MIIDKEQLKQEIKDFLGEEGLQYLKECNNNGTFFIAFGSFLGGNVGIQIRNHLRVLHPELEKYPANKFDVMSAELTLELIS